ncbi:MAG: beta galactosidase jelly roll domain-containing protein [Candidatus Helarchaeota archaeon]|nr:beta galactosidase jelly roll domain-containing protein [Candidatus Helarchaeota archaeon]
MIQKLDGTWKVIKDENNKGEVQKFFISEYNDSEWEKIKVPGHWQANEKYITKLSKDGVYTDYGGPTVWYRTSFIPPSEFKNKIIRLKFNGVFYLTSVWLNGEKLGENEGYFFPFEFDVSDKLDFEKENVLSVKVTCEDEKNIGKKKQITGVLSHWDASDPTTNPGGIWKSVELISTREAYFKNIKIVPKILPENKAKIIVTYKIESEKELEIDLKINVEPKNFEGENITKNFKERLKAGNNNIVEEIEIKDPKLWWTWDHGERNLYTLESQILIENEESETINNNFGIREIYMIEEKGWKVILNGKRIFIRGNNYAPCDMRLAYCTPEDYKRDIQLMKDCNMNMIRVHAHIDSEPYFHDACDEVGILVWQDFPFQWSYSKKVLESAKKQSKKAVELLQNHPSQAIYCTHNEPFELFERSQFILLGLGLIFLLFGVDIIVALYPGKLELLPGIQGFTTSTQVFFELGRETFKDIPFLTFEVLFGLFIVLLLQMPPINFLSLKQAIGLMILFSLSTIIDFFLPEMVIIPLLLETNPIFHTDTVLTMGNLIEFLIFLALTLPTNTIPWNFLRNFNKDKLDPAMVKVLEDELELDKNHNGIIVKNSGMAGIIRGGTDLHSYCGYYWPLAPKYRAAYKYLDIRWKVRFVTEFGAQAFPNKESLEKFPCFKDTPEDIFPLNTSTLVKNHRYQQLFVRNYAKEEDFKTLEAFIQATQDYQAEIAKFHIELFRFMKYDNCGGVIHFLFNDCFPGITWSIVDYWRKPKKAFFVIKNCFEPVYPFVFKYPKKNYSQGKRFKTDLYVVNDLHKEFGGIKLTVDISPSSGEPIFQKEYTVNLEKDSLIKIDNIDTILPKGRSGRYKLNLKLHLLSKVIHNQYEIRIKPPTLSINLPF